MVCSSCRTVVIVACIAGLAAVAGTMAVAQPSKDGKPGAAPAGMPEMPLPPGWTSQDMQARMEAGVPGKAHEELAKRIGVWACKNQMWMGPGMDPISSESTFTISSIMDGRYIRGDMTGDVTGMGPSSGMSVLGFDNVTQKYVGTWIDNHSTGIMYGTGEASRDGKIINWTYNYQCPITKKTTVMRHVETLIDPNTMSLDMYTIDPKSKKEFKMSRIDFTKKS